MGSIPSGISGSRAAAIVGLSRYQTAVGVWLDIMEALEPGFCAAHDFAREEFDGNASTRWGLAFERPIIALSEIAREGDRIIDCEREFRHPRAPFVTCHVDGIYQDAQEIHEGKTTTSWSFGDNWGEPGSDRIPVEYQVQVQHQMMVTGLRRAVVSVLVFPERPDAWEERGLRVDAERGIISCADGTLCDSTYSWARVLRDMGFFHQYVVEASDELHERLLETYVDFWRVHVDGRTPPTATSYEDCKRLFTAPKGTVVADDELERWASEYKQINGEISAMTRRNDQLKTGMIGRMAARAEKPVDGDSCEKWILRGASGKKLGAWDGKVWR
jgi:putative phage-type endonuclease